MAEAQPMGKTALPGIGEAIRDAADLVNQAAGTSLEKGLLGLYGTLVTLAEGAADLIQGSDATPDVAVAMAFLASCIMQSRHALASREITADALAAADDRGEQRGYQRGLRERAEKSRRREASTSPIRGSSRRSGHLRLASGS